MEILKDVVKQSSSFVEVANHFDTDRRSAIYQKIKGMIRRSRISVEHFDTCKVKRRWDEDSLREITEQCSTYQDILKRLDLVPVTSSYDRLKSYLKKYNIDSSKFQKIVRRHNPKWDEVILRDIISNSFSKKEVLSKMGITTPGYHRVLNRYINLYGIDISHFKYPTKERHRKMSLSDILKENSTYSRAALKKRLFKEHLKENVCELCGQGETWNGKKMSLILDHINGVYNDNRIENLRMVCPNCNATLDTHCGKNKARIIREKKLIEKKEKERSEYSNDTFTDAQIYGMIRRRKKTRPEYAVLIDEISKYGYSETGRRHGVSDNSIRKWEKFYKNIGEIKTNNH